MYPASIRRVTRRLRASRGLAGSHGIAVDATHVYWTNRNGNTVMQCPITGGCNTPFVLAGGAQEPTGIALDATSVYWTNTSSGTVLNVKP